MQIKDEFLNQAPYHLQRFLLIPKILNYVLAAAEQVTFD